MKKLFIIIALFCFSGASPAYAQQNAQSSFLTLTGGGTKYIKPVGSLWGLLFPGVASTTSGCLSIATNGWISPSGTACGSGTGAVGTSTIPTIGQLAYWTGNGTPSTLGSVATSSVACTSASGITCTGFNVIGSSDTIALSAIPNSSLANSTISGVALGSSLANLTATDGTLTFSGTYNGATARTIGLNLASANTWTGIQRFYGMASSTIFSAHEAYAGFFTATSTTATSTFTNVIVRRGVATSTEGERNGAFLARVAGGIMSTTVETNGTITFTGAEDSTATFTAGSPDNINLPSNTSYFCVELWGGGGGGGGGGSDVASYAGGGGSGGGYTHKCFYRNQTNTFYYTIGAGSAGTVKGVSGGASASSGGASYFNSSSPAATNPILTANGGGGGGGNGSASGAGGTGVGGDLNIAGQTGGPSMCYPNGGNSPYCTGATGGAGARGSGGGAGGGPGYSSGSVGNGTDGQAPGGGGGGGGNQNSATATATGGTGASGGISIEYYTY